MFSSTPMDSLAEQFERELAAFLERTRLAPSTFGLRAVGDGKFVSDVRRGRSPRLVTVDRVRAYMAEYSRRHGLDRAGDPSPGQRRRIPGGTHISGNRGEVDR